MSNRKGHALLIGINEFSYWTMTKLGNIDAESDVRYWEKLLTESYYYEKPEILLDDDATLDTVILSIFYLALKAQSGDIVTITFSTHGLFEVGKGNALCLYGREEYLTDEMLYFLLRLFKKDVRVVIILDICQSEGFVSNTPFPDDFRVDEQIKNAFLNKDTWEQWIKDVILFLTDVEISASVAVLATASHDLNALDGFIKVYSKEILTTSYSIGRWYAWNFEGYRNQLEIQLEKHYQRHSKMYLSWVKKNLQVNYPRVDTYIKSLPKAIEEYNKDLAGLDNVIIGLNRFVGTRKEQRILHDWLNFWGLAFNRCPHLNWRGVPSDEFKKQYVFFIDPAESF